MSFAAVEAMFLNLLLTLCATASTTAIARAGLSRLAMANACKSAKPEIDALLRRQRHSRSLPRRYQATNDSILEMVASAREARLDLIRRMHADLPEGALDTAFLPELEKCIERAGFNFLATLKTTYLLKVRDLAIGQVADRFDERLDILRHARHELSAMEHRVVDLLDQVGVIDFAENAFELIPEAIKLYSESAAEAATQGLSDFLHATSTICHVPGLISGTLDAIRELKFLAADEVSLGEVFTDGLPPIAIRMIFVKIGASLDGATGWLSLGFFTITCSWLGKFLGDEILRERLQEQIDILNRHLGIIHARQREALAEIRRATNALLDAYRAMVSSCPDIGDEPVLRSYIRDLQASYRMGLQQTNAATARAVERAISNLPQRSRLERFLRINCADQIADLFLAAQRKLESHHLGLVNAFSLACESHAEDAIRFLQTHEIFTNWPTRQVLARQDQVLVQTAGDYARSLTAWEEKCRLVWETGIKEIEETTRREHALTREATVREMEGIKAARRKIAILRRRLGASAEAA